MLFQFGFYSSLLLISFSQGVIFSVLLFIKSIQTSTKSYFWLSIFLLLCSLYIAPWMLGFAGWYDNQPYRDFMFYMPFQHLFFLGPIIYFYTKSLLNPSFKFGKKERAHLLPGLLYLTYSIIILVYDKIVLKKYYFYEDGVDKDFDQWYQIAGLLSMIIYFAVSIKYYTLYKKLIVQVTSFADTILFRWVKNFLFAFLAMQILQVIFYIIGYIHPNTLSYVGGWWYYLIFSIIMYYIAVAGYANQVSAKIPYSLSIIDNHTVMFLQNSPSFLLEDVSTIDIDYEMTEENISPEMEVWKNKILELIKIEKLYENPELTLSDVSKKLLTNASIVSKAINSGFQMNFNNFINHYRIKAVKEMFLQGEHKKQTLLGIAFDCGFNSKATFNRAFKKNTGFSPKEFLKHNK